MPDPSISQVEGSGTAVVGAKSRLTLSRPLLSSVSRFSKPMTVDADAAVNGTVNSAQVSVVPGFEFVLVVSSEPLIKTPTVLVAPKPPPTTFPT